VFDLRGGEVAPRDTRKGFLISDIPKKRPRTLLEPRKQENSEVTYTLPPLVCFANLPKPKLAVRRRNGVNSEIILFPQDQKVEASTRAGRCRLFNVAVENHYRNRGDTRHCYLPWGQKPVR
jgi:hypothetical protein